MEVRELKAKDLKALVKMLGKLTPESRAQIVDLFKGGSKKRTEADIMSLGIGIFQVLAELTDDIYAWLADMAGIKVEELDNLPASVPIDIIKRILARGDIKAFFGSAVQSINKK